MVIFTVNAKFESYSKKVGNYSWPVYKCTVTNAHIPSVTYPSKIKFNEHLPGYTDSNIKELIIKNTQFDICVKDSIVGQFYNVTHMSINYCELRNCDLESFGGYEKLVSLSFDNNNITCIPESLVLPKYLKSLSLVENKITKVDEKFLENLKEKSSLKYLDLRKNLSYNIVFDADKGETIDDFIASLRTFKITPPNFATCLRKANKFLLETEELSDFTIKTSKKDFNVHKNILAANSKVFMGMFSHKMEENIKNKMTITDFSTEVVQEFLNFVYIAEVPVEVTNLLDLFAIASKYNVEQLREFCEEKITLNMTEENVSGILTVANLYNSNKLKEKSFEYIENMFSGMTIDRQLIDKPEEINKIIRVRKTLEDLINKTSKY